MKSYKIDLNKAVNHGLAQKIYNYNNIIDDKIIHNCCTSLYNKQLYDNSSDISNVDFNKNDLYQKNLIDNTSIKTNNSSNVNSTDLNESIDSSIILKKLNNDKDKDIKEQENILTEPYTIKKNTASNTLLSKTKLGLFCECCNMPIPDKINNLISNNKLSKRICKFSFFRSSIKDFCNISPNLYLYLINIFYLIVFLISHLAVFKLIKYFINYRCIKDMVKFCNSIEFNSFYIDKSIMKLCNEYNRSTIKNNFNFNLLNVCLNLEFNIHSILNGLESCFSNNSYLTNNYVYFDNLQNKKFYKYLSLIYSYENIYLLVLYLIFFKLLKNKLQYLELTYVNPSYFSLIIDYSNKSDLSKIIKNCETLNNRDNNKSYNDKLLDISDLFSIKSKYTKITPINVSIVYNINKYLKKVKEINKLEKKIKYLKVIINNIHYMCKENNVSTTQFRNKIKKFIDKQELNIEEIKEYLNKCRNFDVETLTGTIILTFNSVKDKQIYLDIYNNKQENSKFSIIKLISVFRQFKSLDNCVNVSNAPDPYDIVWENLEYDIGLRYKRKLMSYFYAFIIILAAFILVLLINIIQIRYELKKNKMLSYLVSLLITIISSSSSCLLNFTTE